MTILRIFSIYHKCAEKPGKRSLKVLKTRAVLKNVYSTEQSKRAILKNRTLKEQVRVILKNSSLREQLTSIPKMKPAPPGTKKKSRSAAK